MNNVKKFVRNLQRIVVSVHFIMLAIYFFLNDQVYQENTFMFQYTLDKAQSTGVVGWVMNTEAGTVKGTFQGTKFQVDEMYVNNIYFTGSNNKTIVSNIQ